MNTTRAEAARRQVQVLLATLAEADAPGPGGLRDFLDFAASHADCCERTCLAGHFTGSAWLVSGDGERALLLHHRKLNRWLQPGGHADGDGDLSAVALREAEEETGLRGLRVEPAVFDIDRHRIPARGAEPEHWHYDVRFLVRAGDDEAFVVNGESHALQWRRVAEIAADPAIDESVRRLARKSLNGASVERCRSASASPAPDARERR